MLKWMMTSHQPYLPQIQMLILLKASHYQMVYIDKLRKITNNTNNVEKLLSICFQYVLLFIMTYLKNI